MLKRLFVGFLCICIALGLCACGSAQNGSGNQATPSAGESISHSGKKVEGTITKGSVFSEGLAFVLMNNDREKIYCINKEGYIVFEVSGDFSNTYALESLIFKGGYVLIMGNAYDTKGNCTTPESVGATKFYHTAFEGGYILAEKTTADYSSTKKELGVMGTDFKWIVEPSEALYQKLEGYLRSLEALNCEYYYYNDYICFGTQFLNLKTGTLTEKVDFEMPASTLIGYTDLTFRDKQENIVIDLSGLTNISWVLGCEYTNGKAPVLFNNTDAGTLYFTFVNEKGEFLFEPKKIESMSKVGKFCFDGENLLIVDSATGAKHIQSYNSSGEFLGELKPETLGYASYSCDISDGVIYVEGGYNSSHTGYYFTTDLQPLF